jgi:molecular chaperone GrpE
VLDNLERALAAEGVAEDLRRGVEMIVRQLRDALRRYGMGEVAAVGARFDPKVHEAVLREESAEVDHPTVVAELQRGYLLHDRLLRPAMVKVAVPPEPGHGESAPSGGGAAPGGGDPDGETP